MSNNFISKEDPKLHKHSWHFYDGHDETWHHLIKFNGNFPLPRGEVWECNCGARQLRFQCWLGEHERNLLKRGELKF